MTWNWKAGPFKVLRPYFAKRYHTTQPHEVDGLLFPRGTPCISFRDDRSHVVLVIPRAGEFHILDLGEYFHLAGAEPGVVDPNKQHHQFLSEVIAKVDGEVRAWLAEQDPERVVGHVRGGGKVIADDRLLKSMEKSREAELPRSVKPQLVPGARFTQRKRGAKRN